MTGRCCSGSYLFCEFEGLAHLDTKTAIISILTLFSLSPPIASQRSKSLVIIHLLHFSVLNGHPTPLDVNFWNNQLRKVKNNPV
jgi:hypothetical protein